MSAWFLDSELSTCCNFKTALYSSVVITKDFNSSRKLFYAEIITAKLKAGLLLNTSLSIRPLTFINEALRLPVVLFLCPLSFHWYAFTTCCFNIAMPINFIDGKCHIKYKIKGRENP